MEHTPLTPEITLEQALANKGKEKNIKMAFSLHFPRHHGAGDTCPHRERGGANGERDPAVHRDLDGIKWSTSPHPLVPFPFVPPSPAAAAAAGGRPTPRTSWSTAGAGRRNAADVEHEQA